jgi:hypothetical protein
MGTKGVTTVPSQMTREELQTFVLGFVDHRLAVIEERLSALERPKGDGDQNDQRSRQSC